MEIAEQQRYFVIAEQTDHPILARGMVVYEKGASSPHPLSNGRMAKYATYGLVDKYSNRGQSTHIGLDGIEIQRLLQAATRDQVEMALQADSYENVNVLE